MKEVERFDVVVLGGGPAGVTAALRARELEAKVALVERGRMGGTCTNDGCVPTRVLAKAARLIRDAEQFDAYGLVGEAPSVDFARLMTRTQQIINRIHEKKQLLNHLEEAGVVTFANVGAARFADPHTIGFPDGRMLRGESIIICVGGHARRLPFPGNEHALTHSDVWSMRELPGSLAIVGAAATGCQLASVFATFGSKVTLLEAAPRILGTEETIVSKTMEEAFRARGIEVVTGIKGVERIEKREDGLVLHYQGPEQVQTVDVDAVILAVGWPGNVEPLHLADAGVRTEKNYITVDEHLRTSTPHIYAAGDITGRMMLVQSATYEARIAAENAVLGQELEFTHQVVPHGGFTDPEYGSVGLTESEARKEHDVAVALVPYASLDRAVIDGHTDGFFKMIVERDSRRVLGAHVVGEQAVEVVQLVASGMAAGIHVEQLSDLELAYPTYTAIVGLAARELTRKLGIVSPSRRWSGLGNTRMTEWERG